LRRLPRVPHRQREMWRRMVSIPSTCELCDRAIRPRVDESDCCGRDGLSPQTYDHQIRMRHP
jgi:hypothetical protein